MDKNVKVDQIARNSFRVTFAVPTRVAPRLEFFELPVGAKPLVKEVSTLGFIVEFHPRNIEVKTFGFTGDAEL